MSTRARSDWPMPGPLARSVTFGFVLLAGLAIGPSRVAAAEASLARVDGKLLQRAYPGDDYVVLEFPEPQDVDGDCAEKRRFAAFKRLPEAQRSGRTTHGHLYDLTVLLCHGGPLGADRYLAMLEASDQMVQAMIRAQPSLADSLPGSAGRGVPVHIGQRSGRATLLFSVGHGVVMTPLAIIPSREAARNLVIVMDDPHVGEPGHEPSLQQALAVLAEMLKLADQGSAGSP